MKVRCNKGVAIRIWPEPCVGIREDDGEASVGEHIGQPLSRKSLKVSGVDVFRFCGNNMDGCVSASSRLTRRGQRPWHMWKLFVREPDFLPIVEC